MEPFGVYIHVPFCASRCLYCDFASSVWREPPWESFAAAVERELAARSPAFPAAPARSVYFGGGTPSLAPPAVLARLLQAVRTRFEVAPEAELTVEVNPGSLPASGLQALKAVGLNRVSIGWQSTHDRLLTLLGRSHTAEQSRACAVHARRAGFANLSVDLIFAVPGQSLADLDADLDAVEALGPEHVSLYALTYHRGTPLFALREQGRVTPIDEDLEAEMMERIDARLAQAGYEHYEVSNYARPGFRAVHNTLYWTGARYLGLGAAAHSFTHDDDWRRGWRWESRRDVRAYLDAWANSPRGELPQGCSAAAVAAPAAAPARDEACPGRPEPGDPAIEWVEELSERQLLSERMLCAMRLGDGLSLAEPVVARHAVAVERAAEEASRRGWAHIEAGRLKPTPLGLCHADALATLFF